jgi:glyoxylase-like metal-dependent hydrolase (beta-lactamase superfamily II)
MGHHEDIVQIQLPLPHVRSVNAWLLRGEPLTLLDAGPHDDAALAALESGLRRAGTRLEDIELVLATHHHLDHTGLVATVAARSGATVAALDGVAAYGERYVERSEGDRLFSLALMRHHGVPDAVVAENESFWDYIRGASAPFATDLRLAEGNRVRAGGRELRVVARPGHSTTDTLFVDDRAGIALVGDHLLAGISSNTEIYPAAEADGTRPRARVEYLASLAQTARMPLRRLLTGHGSPVTGHGRLVQQRFAEHERRCRRIAAELDSGPATAYAIAHELWSPRTVTEQPLLVVWEVLGHLDLLLGAGAVDERVGEDGIARFALARPGSPRRSDARPAHGRSRAVQPGPPGGGRPARASRQAH